MEDSVCVESKFKQYPDNLTKLEENTNLFNTSPFNAQLYCETLEDEVISSLA